MASLILFAREKELDERINARQAELHKRMAQKCAAWIVECESSVRLRRSAMERVISEKDYARVWIRAVGRMDATAYVY